MTNKTSIANGVGILGGMGPYATMAFYHKILQYTPAKKDWDHVRVIIDVNTKIPSRSRHHLYNEASPVPAMIESCKKLENYPVDLIVIPCNSASFYIPKIQPLIEIPILNIVDITVDELKKKLPSVKRVAVWGGVVTYDQRIYESYLRKSGIDYIHHSQKFQKQIEKIIEQIKCNESVEIINQNFKQLISQTHFEQKTDAVILGCTEFGCITNLDLNIPVIDSSSALARYVSSL